MKTITERQTDLYQTKWLLSESDVVYLLVLM